MMWKQINNYSRYEISNDGQIYNKQTKELMSQNDNGGGYMQVYLRSDDGQRKRLYVHRLVYMAHGGTIPKGYEINHIDENKTNNDISNLECITHTQNQNHGTRSERASNSKQRPIGQYTPTGKLICVWRSMTEANKHGYGIGHVCACCNGRQNLYKGFAWRYIVA